MGDHRHRPVAPVKWAAAMIACVVPAFLAVSPVPAETLTLLCASSDPQSRVIPRGSTLEIVGDLEGLSLNGSRTIPILYADDQLIAAFGGAVSEAEGSLMVMSVFVDRPSGGFVVVIAKQTCRGRDDCDTNALEATYDTGFCRIAGP